MSAYAFTWAFIIGAIVVLLLIMLWDYWRDSRPQRGDDGQDSES